MNKNTTLLLALVLAGLVGLLYLVKERNLRAELTAAKPPEPVQTSVTRDLFEKKPGEAVKVVVEKAGEEEKWVFEKDADSGQWKATAPVEMPCVRWEVDRFDSQIRNLRYDLAFRPDEPGAVSAKEAGLDPPRVVITLTDKDGRSETVEIGKPGPQRTTYVRLRGQKKIVLAKADLSRLVKDRLLDYREKQVFDFPAEDAKKIRIEDRSEDAAAPAVYVFSRGDGRWMMEQPVTARVTDKVDEMVRTMGRLRAIAWVDQGPDAPRAYGLDPAAVTVEVTVEREVPVEKKEEKGEKKEEDESSEDGDGEDEESQPETKTETSVYVLHLSDRSPIGEDNKVFFRVDDDSAVATVMKTTADKFRPVMDQWRDMKITPVPVADATRIELTTGSGRMTLVKNGTVWTFEEDGGKAAGEAVSELLDAIDHLRAVVFLDEAASPPETYGFDQPQADVRLTIPGVEGTERITVGSYTDARTRRLVYVSRNRTGSVAKVRVEDVARLLRPPHVYRDRVVLDVLPSQFREMTIAWREPDADIRHVIDMERRATEWWMTAPIEVELASEKVDKLAATLGGLKAQTVVAESGEESAYGLHDPEVTLTLRYSTEEGNDQQETPEEAKEKKDNEPASGEEASSTREVVLMVTRHDGKAYAKRADRGTIYAVSPSLVTQLTQEFRKDRVMPFEAADVTRFSIRHGQTTHVFARRDDKWIYEPEPDLPLDKAKVENLLLQVRDLRTPRFVEHTLEDLAPFGLDDPAVEVMVSFKDGSARTLRVAAEPVTRMGIGGYYASADGVDGVFLLTQPALDRIEVDLAALEAQAR